MEPYNFVKSAYVEQVLTRELYVSQKRMERKVHAIVAARRWWYKSCRGAVSIEAMEEGRKVIGKAIDEWRREMILMYEIDCHILEALASSIKFSSEQGQQDDERWLGVSVWHILEYRGSDEESLGKIHLADNSVVQNYMPALPTLALPPGADSEERSLGGILESTAKCLKAWHSSLPRMASARTELSEDEKRCFSAILRGETSWNQAKSEPEPHRATKRQQISKDQTKFKHICSVCSKSFTRATTLREHIRSHTNERPFACSSCPTRFARLKDKKRHESIHDGEKPYACGGMWEDLEWGCSRRFARQDGLIAHLRTDQGWKCLESVLKMQITKRSLYKNWFYHNCYSCSQFTGRDCNAGLFSKSLEDLRVHFQAPEGKNCAREWLVLIRQHANFKDGEEKGYSASNSIISPDKEESHIDYWPKARTCKAPNTTGEQLTNHINDSATIVTPHIPPENMNLGPTTNSGDVAGRRLIYNMFTPGIEWSKFKVYGTGKSPDLWSSRN